MEPLYESPLGNAQAGADGIMFGFTNNPSENFDAFLATSIRDFLFREGEEENGLDLMALNIQRGRDHGIGCEYNLDVVRASVVVVSACSHLHLSHRALALV